MIHAMVYVKYNLINFEVPYLKLSRVITIKELINTYNDKIDLVIIEYKDGDSLVELDGIEANKIVLISNDKAPTENKYEFISPVTGLNSYIENKLTYDKVIDNYKEEVEQLKALNHEISNNLAVSVNRNELEQLELEYTSKIEALTQECSLKVDKSLLETLQSEYNNLVNINEALNNNQEDYENKVKYLQDTIIGEYNDLLKIQELLNEKVNDCDYYRDKLQQLEVDYKNKLQDLQDKHTSQYNDKEVELNKIKDAYKKLYTISIDLKEKVNQYSKNQQIIEDYVQEIREKYEIDKGLNVAEVLEKVVSDSILDSHTSSKNNEKINELLNKISTYEERVLKSESLIEDKNKIIERINNDITELKKSYDEKVKEIEQLDSLNVKPLQTEKFEIKGSYTSKAKIINVFGCGSHGITSVAINIAEQIPSKKTLIIDFDLVTPKVDAYLKRSPMIKVGDKQKSSYDCLLGNQDSYNKIQSTIISISSHTDYFSGAYRGISESELSSIDFPLLMNKLGNMYEYIIIDCGKMGYSGASDELIRFMSNASHSNVIVTSNDYFDIRGMSSKLNSLALSKDNTLWVLNRSKQVGMMPHSEKYLKGYNRVIVVLEESLFGEYKLWNKFNTLKLKVNEIIKLIK